MGVRITIFTIILFTALISLYYLIYRPWSLSWGATNEEINRDMKGDDILNSPSFVATRGISIQASPEAVWPWIVQIGYRRAGFYSYDRLDNDGIHSSDTILPEYQGLRVGDVIPITKEVDAVVVILDPYETMVLDFLPWVWSWRLDEIETGYTRLVTRVYYRSESIFFNFLADTFEIFMMRKCLLEIKHRVESTSS